MVTGSSRRVIDGGTAGEIDGARSRAIKEGIEPTEVRGESRLRRPLVESTAALVSLGETRQACQDSLTVSTVRPRRRDHPVRAVFLDRDGTLIVDKPYNANPDDIVILPGVLEGLQELSAAGYLLVVVTNQSGVARGYYDHDAVVRMHDRLNQMLGPAGVRIAAYYYCPHHVDGVDPRLALPCPFRKPGPGMLFRAAMDWAIHLRRSWFIGDQPTDVGAARAARCRPILVGPAPAPRVSRVARARGLREAARAIIALDGRASSTCPSAHPRVPRR